jgi:uncharacterized protein YdeI (YjbR/CyaY-like superfamily)
LILLHANSESGTIAVASNRRFPREVSVSTRDSRVDRYIEKSAEFAKPILNYIREVVHSACPDVEETLKWGFPHFMYKGILCSMASFKQHCAVGFWKGALVFKSVPNAIKRENTAMGQLGRITSLADLPDRKTLTRCIIEAVRLNETGTKLPSKPKPAKTALVVPNDLMIALRKNKRALATFDSFSYSQRKEYVEWITEAKTDATRLKRLKSAIEWMEEGKSRNWKYMNR